MKTRKTNYNDGTLLKLIDNDFNSWEIRVTVKVVGSDWHQYHVKNMRTGDHIWLYEKQVEPIN